MGSLKRLPEKLPKDGVAAFLNDHNRIAYSRVFLCPSPTPIELPLKCFCEKKRCPGHARLLHIYM
jgi:hypothetical protein